MAPALAYSEADWYTRALPFRNTRAIPEAVMTLRQRKFVGVLLVLFVLVAYAVLAVSLADVMLTGTPTWLQIVYYAVAGIGWAVPAGIVIRWMQRPDDSED